MYPLRQQVPARENKGAGYCDNQRNCECRKPIYYGNECRERHLIGVSMGLRIRHLMGFCVCCGCCCTTFRLEILTVPIAWFKSSNMFSTASPQIRRISWRPGLRGAQPVRHRCSGGPLLLQYFHSCPPSGVHELYCQVAESLVSAWLLINSTSIFSNFSDCPNYLLGSRAD